LAEGKPPINKGEGGGGGLVYDRINGVGKKKTQQQQSRDGDQEQRQNSDQKPNIRKKIRKGGVKVLSRGLVNNRTGDGNGGEKSIGAGKTGRAPKLHSP